MEAACEMNAHLGWPGARNEHRPPSLFVDERESLAADRGFRHRPADRPEEDRDASAQRDTRRIAPRDHDTGAVGREIELALLEPQERRLVVEHDQFLIALAADQKSQ